MEGRPGFLEGGAPPEILLQVFHLLPWRERLRGRCVCKYWALVIDRHHQALFQRIDGLHCTSRTIPFLEKCRALTLTDLRLVAGADKHHLRRLGHALRSAKEVQVICEEPLVPNAFFEGMRNLRLLYLTWRYFLPDDLMEGLVSLPDLEHLSLGGVCFYSNSLLHNAGGEPWILSSRWHNGRPIPLALLRLTNLVSLKCRNCAIAAIPDEIMNLQRLTELCLPCNRISRLPDALGKVTTLQRLDLCYNSVESIPESLGGLSNLTLLNLDSSYPLQHIADGALTGMGGSLVELHISYCRQLHVIPSTIQSLTRLEKLKMPHTHSALPLTFSALCSLREFSSHGSHWRAPLPNNMFGERCPITDLDISTNNMERIPASVSRLTALTALNISDNSFLCVPSEIMSLTQLRSLNVSYILTPTLPGFLSVMSDLADLAAYGNPLGDFPTILCGMTSLKTLHLAKTGLKALPNEITQLKQLEQLVLCYNNIAELPASMATMTCLKKLRLAMNNLTGALPGWFGQLRSLVLLDCSSNRLDNMGDLSALTNLQHVDFSYNQLRFVPAHVRRLPQLKELSVQGNPKAAVNIPCSFPAPAG